MKKHKAPTVKDVAEVARVSIGTVSSVLHGKLTVNAKIRQRVLAAIAEVGFTPNAIAQSMRLGSTRTIGVVVREIGIPSVAAFVSASQDVLYENGYATLLASFGDRRDRQIDLFGALMRRKVDGFIVSQNPEIDEEIEVLLRKISCPLVLVEREHPIWADAVLVDHFDAIRRATEYLLRLGHRRIGMLVGDPNLFPSRQRIAGFKSAHEMLGVPIDPALMMTERVTADYGYEQTIRMTQMHDVPTAIVAGGPLLSGVLRALARTRMRIPEDMSIVATSNSDLAELTVPAISTERWNAHAVGVEAAKVLLQRIGKRASVEEPRRITIRAEFSLRDSCAPPRAC